jgi:hypothetical protein
VDGQSYLGIYIGKAEASVVCLRPHGKGHDVAGCFSISLQAEQEKTPKSLAEMIAKGCAERNLKFEEVSVALDCSFFMQHKVHSEFTDIKQISSTVRFDTEEALATDISDISLAFDVTSNDKSGSSLTVFTSQKKQLADLISGLQSSGLDPVSVEPDVHCLARFFSKTIGYEYGSRPFFAMLSNTRGYLIIFTEPDKGAVMRTLLIGSQQRQQLLAREIPVTIALANSNEPISCVRVFDSSNSVNVQRLGSDVHIKTEVIDLQQATAAGENVMADCKDAAGFAVAYGAALTHAEKSGTINFRNDFMPYLGAKKRMEKAFRFVSIVASILLIVVGYYMMPQWVQKNKDYKEIKKNIDMQYGSIVPNGKLSGEKLQKRLERLLMRIKNESKGSVNGSGEKTIAAKITLVLQAFNQCAKATQLEVDSIKVSKKIVTIVGTTLTNKDLLQLKGEIEKLGFDVTPQFEVDAGRTKFTLTAVSK